MKGTTLRLTLWDKDKTSSVCTCLGEYFHLLEHVENMKSHLTINDMPAIMKVLGRLPKENLECLEVLVY